MRSDIVRALRWPAGIFAQIGIPLAFEQLRKVLNGMSDQEFYSVGIRSTSPTATAESYRIVAGSNADRGVRDTDAANFTQGHFMGRGQVNGAAEVIGASAGGRVWSNGKLSIPEIIDWMDALHGRITADQVNIGRSGLDFRRAAIIGTGTGTSKMPCRPLTTAGC